jgi:hypothetical protein
MIEGAIDLHAHCGPDTRPRRMSALELARAAREAGMRGVVLKNHDTPTTSLAATVGELCPGFAVRGGVALNDAVGGFNPAAVETALRMGAAEIWMPTHCAARERAFRGRPGGLSVFDGGGALRAEVREIMRLIAGSSAILGTGHLGPEEIAVVVREARAAGVRKVLVTHPEIAFVDLPLSAQRELCGPGLWFERCYVRPNFATDWDGLAHAIRETGAGNNVLATDLGQPDNPAPPEGLRRMCLELHSRGFSAAELRAMAAETPARLLELPL